MIKHRKQAITICLTLALFAGSVWASWSAEAQNIQNAYDSGDYATALREITPLAEQGIAAAQFLLGVMYYEGQGVPKNDKTAAKWYGLAAEQGYATAQTQLGVMYATGRGVPKDDKAAVKLHTLAAEQGHSSAQARLASMYYVGQGVVQDYKTAAKFYTLAAEQGNALAQSQLGMLFALGEGVREDDVYAHMWANLSASNGNETGRELRELVAEGMTQSQIAEAQKLARECVNKNYKGC